jgi:hypothetical protein
VVIPKHISISNQAVVTHLNEYAPLWQEKWQEFTVLQGSADESLNPQAIDDSSYKKVDSDFVITEEEKQEHIKSSRKKI